MEASHWQTLFQSIRHEDQENIVIALVGGFEVAVQQFSRVEEGLVMIRGRVAGQAESGRLFLVPYSHIAAVYVNREVLTEEVDLFSPSVPLERKAEVAKMVTALHERQREEARKAEASKGQGNGVTIDLKRQLEALRESAGFSSPPANGAAPAPPPAAANPPPPSQVDPSAPSAGRASPATMGNAARATLPPRPALPRPPRLS